MECAPLAKLDVVNFATPALRLTTPNVVVPFLNVTLPVGVPRRAAFTVAVNVTAVPNVDGFLEEDNDVELASVCDGFGSLNTTTSSEGAACVGAQLLHLV